MWLYQKGVMINLNRVNTIELNETSASFYFDNGFSEEIDRESFAIDALTHLDASLATRLKTWAERKYDKDEIS